MMMALFLRFLFYITIIINIMITELFLRKIDTVEILILFCLAASYPLDIMLL